MPNHNTKPRMSSRPISIRNLRARVYRMHMESLQLYRDLEAHPNKHHVDAFNRVAEYADIGAANMFYAALQSATKRGISEHRKGGIA